MNNQFKVNSIRSYLISGREASIMSTIEQPSHVGASNMASSMAEIKQKMTTSSFRRWMIAAKAGKELSCNSRTQELKDSFLMAFAFEQNRTADKNEILTAVGGVKMAVDKVLQVVSGASSSAMPAPPVGKIETEADTLDDMIPELGQAASSPQESATELAEPTAQEYLDQIWELSSEAAQIELGMKVKEADDEWARKVKEANDERLSKHKEAHDECIRKVTETVMKLKKAVKKEVDKEDYSSKRRRKA